MQVRRVVTGQNAAGKSVFVSDEQLDPTTVSLLPGAEFLRIWGYDATAPLPTDGSPPPQQGWFPPVGGFRFAFFTLGPNTVTMPADLDMGAALAKLSRKLPGLADVMEPDHPGMQRHRKGGSGVHPEGLLERACDERLPPSPPVNLPPRATGLGCW